MVKSWKDVQNNLGKFQGLFGTNFAVVDNSKFLKPEKTQKKFGMIVKKYINKFIKGSCEEIQLVKNGLNTIYFSEVKNRFLKKGYTNDITGD